MSDTPPSPIELPAEVTRLETGLTFDEFVDGQRFLTGTRLVTEDTVRDFAAVSGDDNPVHLDPAFARRTFFRGVVAHGALTQAVATGLGWQTGLFKDTLIAIAENNAAYKQPVRPGDELRVVFEVLEHEPEPAPKWGHVRFGLTVINQSGTVVALGTWYCLVRRSR